MVKLIFIVNSFLDFINDKNKGMYCGMIRMKFKLLVKNSRRFFKVFIVINLLYIKFLRIFLNIDNDEIG